MDSVNTTFSLRSISDRQASLILVAAVLLVFGRLLAGDFLWWDDMQTIALNDRMIDADLESLAFYWTHEEYGLWVPVTQTVWWTLSHLAALRQPDASGVTLNPMLFKLTSLALHATSAWLVFQLLRRTVARTSVAAALIGAALFALHPLQVESVGWTSGMKDLLCWTFGLGALLLWTIRSSSDPARRWRSWHMPLATLLLILAMLSKPTAVVIPVAAVVIDRVWFGLRLRTSVLQVLPWVALACVVGVVARDAQDASHIIPPAIWQKPLVAGDALAFYLWKIIWPGEMGMDYGRRPDVVLAEPMVYVRWLVPAGLGVLAWLVRRRRPEFLLGLTLFVLGVGPVLGFTPFLFQLYSTVSDHYLYFSLVGVGCVLAGTLARMGDHRPLYVAAAWVGVLGAIALGQTRVWLDSRSLLEHSTRVNPRSYAAHTNLSVTLLQKGDIPGAEAAARRSIELLPEQSLGYHSLARVLLVQRRFDEMVKAIETAEQLSAKHRPGRSADRADALLRFARDLISAGRPDLARPMIDRALAGHPDHPMLADTEAAYRRAIAP
jgi:hypothetical protein